MSETMMLLQSTKSKTNNDENGEYAPYLEINDLVLVHRNIVNISINITQYSCIHLFQAIVWSI